MPLINALSGLRTVRAAGEVYTTTVCVVDTYFLLWSENVLTLWT